MAGKMKALNTAIFSNYSPDTLTFPTCLVSEWEFNAQGDVIFSMKFTNEDIKSFDLAFPGHMHFFNSAFDYYVETHGTAAITLKEQLVCVAFRIVKAQYSYSARGNSKGLGKLFHIFMEFIFAQKRPERWYDCYSVINNN